MKKTITILAASVALAVFASAAFAAVTFNAADGTGFVGKGDVQLVYNWNNKALQDNAASVQFQAESKVVTEVSWVCTNTKHEHEQPRARTTTTTVEGVVDSIARDKKGQITGFNLTGYAGGTTEDVVNDGPGVNSCPGGKDWSLTTPAGDPEEVSSSSALQVSIDGADWFDLE
ncbi:MAG: hypothetical protein KY469_21875 [Actinobacteria bacterium]|nr:hypothetical protein [Actinomycetota bacterium]